MEMNEEIRIEAPRARVYEALNDPAILKECIPGCEELIQHSDTDLEARVTLKIGPVKARFGGKVTLDKTDAPGHFTLTGEGNGGVAGFAKGGAAVELIEDGDATVMRYAATVDIGGKIAQLGSRLINSTAQRLAKSFFEKFKDKVEGDVPAQLAVASEEH